MIIATAFGALTCGKVADDDMVAHEARGEAMPSDWTMLGYDSASTYFNRNETRISRQSVGTLKDAFPLR